MSKMIVIEGEFVEEMPWKRVETPYGLVEVQYYPDGNMDRLYISSSGSISLKGDLNYLEIDDIRGIRTNIFVNSKGKIEPASSREVSFYYPAGDFHRGLFDLEGEALKKAEEAMREVNTKIRASKKFSKKSWKVFAAREYTLAESHYEVVSQELKRAEKRLKKAKKKLENNPFGE